MGLDEVALQIVDGYQGLGLDALKPCQGSLGSKSEDRGPHGVIVAGCRIGANNVCCITAS